MVTVCLSFMPCGFRLWQFSTCLVCGLWNCGVGIGIGPGSAICDGHLILSWISGVTSPSYRRLVDDNNQSPASVGAEVHCRREGRRPACLDLCLSEAAKVYGTRLFDRSSLLTLQSQLDPIIARSHQKLSGGFEDVRGTNAGTGAAGIGSDAFRLAFTINRFSDASALGCVTFQGLRDAMTTAGGLVSGGLVSGRRTTGGATAIRWDGRTKRSRYGLHTM